MESLFMVRIRSITHEGDKGSYPQLPDWAVRPCTNAPAGKNPCIRSICCTGTDEQIQKMHCEPFLPVIMGSFCQDSITWPDRDDRNCAEEPGRQWPEDPARNRSLLPDMMAIGISYAVAVRIAVNPIRSLLSSTLRWHLPGLMCYPSAAFTIKCNSSSE